MFPTLPSASTIARLHTEARAEIHRLRGEAVDDFWRGADAVWQRSLAGGQMLAQRSTARLKARLARHHQPSNRSTTSSTTKA